MKRVETPLEGLWVIEPDVFHDERGFFLETYRDQRYRDLGIEHGWVQDNASWSQRGVLRGLHLQAVPHAQAKLVGVLLGEVFDVAVDLRVGSPTFGRWHGVRLSAPECRQLYIPEGFAHGFCVLSEVALLSYKCSAAYAPRAECTLLFSDPGIGIDWPLSDPRVSPKDREGIGLADLDRTLLPAYPSS